MKRVVNLSKSLGYAYLITMALILIYNLCLTYTSMSSSSIPLAVSIITTLGSAISGFYVSYKNENKGFLYGVIAGFIYILLIFVIYFLIKVDFKFDMSMVYKILLNMISGGIGGILGVNLK